MRLLVVVAILLVSVLAIGILLRRKRLPEALALALVTVLFAVFNRPVELLWDRYLGAGQPAVQPTASVTGRPAEPPGPTPTAGPTAGTGAPSAGAGNSTAPTGTPGSAQPSAGSTISRTPVVPTVVPTTRVRPPAVPAELVGSWEGGGNQYPNDSFYQSVEVTFTGDNQYAMRIGGVLNDGGRFDVDGQRIVFRSAQTRPYAWGWGLSRFAGRPMLNLQNTHGGVYSLDKL